LEGIIAQQLIPKVGGGRVVAVEVLIATPAVRNVIRAEKTEQIATLLQTNAELGMIGMDKSLLDLYEKGLITYDDAITRATDPRGFIKFSDDDKAKIPPQPYKKFVGR
jgi:twitching motility protein PilT